MKAGAVVAIFLLCLAPSLVAGMPADNAELQKIRDEDQADRAGVVDWSKVAPRDEARLGRVLEIVRKGDLHTATDYGNAALVFQHGNSLEEIRTAHALATLAMNMDPDNASRRWLVAASWDRLLVNQLRPQWYGTQFKGDAQGMYLYPVDEDAVTDAERVAMGIPTLAESRQHVAEAARMSGLPVRETPPTLDALRKEATAAKTAEH